MGPRGEPVSLRDILYGAVNKRLSLVIRPRGSGTKQVPHRLSNDSQSYSCGIGSSLPSRRG